MESLSLSSVDTAVTDQSVNTILDIMAIVKSIKKSTMKTFGELAESIESPIEFNVLHAKSKRKLLWFQIGIVFT